MRRAFAVAASVAVVAASVGTGSAGIAAGKAPTGSTSGQHAHRQPAALGHWTIAATVRFGAKSRYAVRWTSPTRLPVTDARPTITSAAGHVGATHLLRDGRTVRALVTATSQPRSSDLAVVLSGRDLTRVAHRPSYGTPPPFTPPAVTSLLTTDPGVPGSHQIVESDYRLPAEKLPGIPRNSEMIGHIVRPKDADAADPLVLFLHGRHSACYVPTDGAHQGPPAAKAADDWHCRKGQRQIPSYLGYDYIQRTLATQGYVTVSISANAINDLDYRLGDGGAHARAALIRHHLAHWVHWATTAKYSVDMSNVILVGHSRGGEGVDRASIEASPTAGYTITGQVLIAPTDFAYETAANVPTVTLLPYCDGDVSDLEGQRFTDTARDVPGAALHSSVLVLGADHNFFNSEWTPGASQAPSNDDWFGNGGVCGRHAPTRLTPFEQRKVGRTYVAGAVHLFALGETSDLSMFDGTAVQVPSAGDAITFSHQVGGSLDIVRPGDGSTLDPTELETSICNGFAGGGSGRPNECAPLSSTSQTPHWPSRFETGQGRSAFEMSWTSAGHTGGLKLDEAMNLSGDSFLDLRTAVDPAEGNVKVGVKLYDGTRSVVVTPVSAGVIPALPRGRDPLSKLWAQTLQVPLTGLDAGDIDLAHITKVDLLTKSDQGHLWVLDLAGVPAAG